LVVRRLRIELKESVRFRRTCRNRNASLTRRLRLLSWLLDLRRAKGILTL
jgi:hypothetical protein